MAATWVHPQLGTFNFEYDGWERLMDVPAFGAFAYEGAGAARPKGQFKLQLASKSAKEVPGAAAVMLAVKMVEQAQQVVRVVTEGLWEDMGGRGPESGSWWRGNLAEVQSNMQFGRGTAKKPPTLQ